MSTFVLIHGAWHGGWCWGRVRSTLERQGHQVFAPTLTGLSDRAHLLSPAVGLSTHIEDIVRLIEAEDLRDVVLVGHSYAGLIVSGVACALPQRIGRRVYLDAFLPEDGEAGIDLLPETVAHHYRESVAGPGFGYVHIPVSWDHPPRADVESFLAAMEKFHGKRVLVHCYAGSRASAFVFMYRVLKLDAERTAAHATLEAIWANNPGYELPKVPQWGQLIDDVLLAHAP